MNIIRLAPKIAGIFSSLAVLIIGTVVLLNTMSLDFDTVMYAAKFCTIGAAVAGIFGYFIGKVLEGSDPKKSSSKRAFKNSDLLIDDLLVQDLDKISNES